MKTAIIIHGWGFTPEMNWYSWLKKELEKEGYKVLVPKMPNTDEPKIEDWVSKLSEVGRLNDENVLIGHSIGCQAILRYLQENRKKVSKIVFVAPWLKLDGKVIEEEGEEVVQIAKPWIETQINFDEVRKSCSDFFCIFSSNDPYGCLDYNSKTFKKNLGARVIMLEDKGHFTEDDGVKEIPEILKFVK